ncbi:SAM-dependent methyltransferase [Spongiactinospora gelatinilytica]|uniref:SAM-dependent methyltransferase n=1 Tax=Spongiactinospora gelatinilytica TaxID=2666298 RepID=A0A2W2FZ15_9ACTN|nr:class I SAM-dependent methyltransferase [Spongiactinospora gelatinilytica]PZG40991.1 SAM-dependent methyltransferase [Spongiactinospora gelatinilytica]
MADPYWNHNVHYQRLVLKLVPEGCAHALDIGCGDGLLARKLSARAGSVTGADRHLGAIETARAQHGDVPGLSFVQADYLDDPAGSLPEGKFDFISAVAVVHHADFGQATTALTRLLAPGGRLVVIGLAQNRSPLDWIISGTAQVVTRLHQLRHGPKSGAGMPAMDPAMSWGDVGRAARVTLPGCHWRRLLLRRYLLVWDKPGR